MTTKKKPAKKKPGRKFDPHAVRRGPRIGVPCSEAQRQRWHAAAAHLGESLAAVTAAQLDKLCDELGL